MNYLRDLEKICRVNSFTKNKSGVDKGSEHMRVWVEEIGV